MAYLGAPTSTAAQHGYIGKAPASASYFEITDISGSFNGSTQTFALQSGGASISPASHFQTIVALDGVVQEPGTAYTISGSNITFTGGSGPASSVTFWGIVMGDAFNIGTPNDGSVVADTLATGAVTSAKILDGTIANTDFAAASVDSAAIKALAVGTGEIAASAVTAAKVADSAVTFNKLNANTAHVDRVQAFTVAQRGTIADQGVRTGPASTNTVTLDLATSNYFKLTSNANISMANPSNVTAGQGGAIVFVSNGSFTVSWGSQWRFPTGSAPTMSTTAAKVDRVDYFVQSANTIHSVATIDLLGTA